MSAPDQAAPGAAGARVRPTSAGQPPRAAKATASTSTRPIAPPATASAPAPRRPHAELTGTQLATAFEGKLERVPTTFGYRVGIVLVACMMVLLPLVYVGIIALAAWLTIQWPSYAGGMFRHVRGRAAIFVAVIFVAPLLAGVLLVIAMILPMFWRSTKGPRPFYVDEREQPLLYGYIRNLCRATGAPMPARIDVIATADASAHIDNGIFGLFRRRLVLTIGLPLVATMDLKQFTGVLAHELGHFSQGIFMRLSYAVHLINHWFARMAWGRSGIDDVLDSAMGSEIHWSVLVIGGVCKLVLFVARLVMMGMALISHGLSMSLSRQAEFDADRRAARIVGSEPLGTALQVLPALSAAGEASIERAQGAWTARRLPDDLVLLTQHLHRHMPQAMREKLDAAILSNEDSWFDSHPPLFKRVAALKKAGYAGVMKVNGPATVLFKDFDEMCKFATLDLYSTVLGPALQPEHLVPTKLPTTQTVRV
jgi:Zn-dependent protease with chaperone function